VGALAPDLALKLYYSATNCPEDRQWIQRLVLNVPDAEEVERQYRKRLRLRKQAPKAAIDFKSVFLNWITPHFEDW
jgi:hypothetical protein